MKKAQQLTHLSCAVVDVSMVALNSSHGVLATSTQLLTNNIFSMLAIIMSKIIFYQVGIFLFYHFQPRDIVAQEHQVS